MSFLLTLALRDLCPNRASSFKNSNTALAWYFEISIFISQHPPTYLTIIILHFFYFPAVASIFAIHFLSYIVPRSFQNLSHIHLTKFQRIENNELNFVDAYVVPSRLRFFICHLIKNLLHSITFQRKGINMRQESLDLSSCAYTFVLNSSNVYQQDTISIVVQVMYFIYFSSLLISSLSSGMCVLLVHLCCVCIFPATTSL